jgi:D-glycero-D-manno-heptose 1,7-bisphosphate phosphatase
MQRRRPPPSFPKALLLDRDGVLNEDRPESVLSWEAFRFLPGSLEALARLNSLGKRVFLVTNQSCIGRGLLSPEGLSAIHGRMVKEIRRAGGNLDGIYVCPHRPDEGCSCRKPGPGLITQALREHALNPSETLFVGDSFRDWEAARAAGISFALVRTGKGEETYRLLNKIVDPLLLGVFRDLLDVVRWILS